MRLEWDVLWSDQWAHHCIFECFGGTFLGYFHTKDNFWRSRNVNGHFVEMSAFVQNRHLKLFPSFLHCVFPQREGRQRGGEKKTPSSQITLSRWWNNLQVSFVSIALSQNSQEHNVCRLPNHQASFILPLMPFNFIIMTADTYTLSVSIWHTQTHAHTHTSLWW